RKVAALRDWVSAVNITDNQGASVRLASWAGSLAALAAGVEPVMQVTCRDRNRIALQSDLLGASALGIPNILIMTGDHPRFGHHSGATPAFVLDSIQLLRGAQRLRAAGAWGDVGNQPPAGFLKPPLSFFPGRVETRPGPPAPPGSAAPSGQPLAA